MKKQPPKKESSTAAKILLAILWLVNLSLTLALHVRNRKEILHAVKNEDGEILLITGKAENTEQK